MEAKENSLSEGWVIDASNSTSTTMCFVHMAMLNHYIQSGGTSTEMGVLFSDTPPGAVLGVIHLVDENELKNWITANIARLRKMVPPEQLDAYNTIATVSIPG